MSKLTYLVSVNYRICEGATQPIFVLNYTMMSLGSSKSTDDAAESNMAVSMNYHIASLLDGNKVQFNIEYRMFYEVFITNNKDVGLVEDISLVSNRPYITEEPTDEVETINKNLH